MAEALIGKWRYESMENLDTYMDAIGVPEQVKEMAREHNPEVEISKSGSDWTITTTVGEKVIVTKYPENEEIEAMHMMGKTHEGMLIHCK
ncbi:fatty acid-binding protein 2, liver-like [Physella acuta]|uniref:fatty acid-binding protein 2, liver-like n=1 Tax=Physella acuta TaxID=109671 RepID=UPI0027DCEAF4|nr:fatty acid-binding protein 2, liver-like [Physella acuta]